MSQPAGGRNARRWSCCFAVATAAALAMACGSVAHAASEPARATHGKGDRSAPPPLPERAPPHKASTPAQTPVKASTVPYGPPLPTAWPPEKVEAALAECRQLLAGQPIEYEILPPIKEKACGLPAPIKLKAFNTEPKAELHPPAIVTCKEAAALGRWFNEYVQPAAKKLLQATIVRTRVLASYHCRNRYNDPSQPLSNHALGEAIDIGGFTTAKGEKISLLEHWPAPPPPPPASPVAAKNAKLPRPGAAGNEATATPGAKTAARRAPGKGTPSPSPEGAAAKPDAPAGIVKVNAVNKPPPPVEDARGQFLKAVHDGACTIFGTVLGPEANAAHKNHFHLDVQHRRHVLCDHYRSKKKIAAGKAGARPAKRSVVKRKKR